MKIEIHYQSFDYFMGKRAKGFHCKNNDNIIVTFIEGSFGKLKWNLKFPSNTISSD